MSQDIADGRTLYFWVPSDPRKPWEALMPLNPGDDLHMAAWHIVYLLGRAVLLSSLVLASARPRPACVGPDGPCDLAGVDVQRLQVALAPWSPSTPEVWPWPVAPGR